MDPHAGKVWWLLLGQQKKGPFTLEEMVDAIQAGAVTEKTPVWKKGMAKWGRLGGVPELAEHLPQPEIDEPSPPPPPDSLTANGAGSSGVTLKASTAATQHPSVLWTIGIAVVVIAACAGMAALSSQHLNPRNAREGAGILLVVAATVEVLMLVSGIMMKCPSCKRWWASSLVEKEEIDRKQGIKTVTRRDVHASTHKSRYGQKIGSTQGTTARKEQIVVTVVTYRNHYKCRHCDHLWTTISKREREGTI